MQLNNERKKRVIDLYIIQHKTYAEIAEIERIAPRDIQIILEEKARQQKMDKIKDRQQQQSFNDS